MTTQQLCNYIKNHVVPLLSEIKQQNEVMLQLVTEAVGDPYTIALLQKRVSDTNKALREMEYEQWFTNKNGAIHKSK